MKYSNDTRKPIKSVLKRCVAIITAIAVLMSLPTVVSGVDGDAVPSDIVFIKPSLSTIVGVRAEGGKYLIDTAMYPVIAVKQGTFLMVWRESAWTPAAKTAYLAAARRADASMANVSDSSVYFYYGYDKFGYSGGINSDGPGTNNFGNYYFFVEHEGRWYLSVDKISHYTLGEDKSYVGNLTVEKELGGYYAVYDGVNADTMYRAKVKDIITGRYLTFTGSNASGYVYSGSNTTGTEVIFSVNSPANINGIPASVIAQVEETGSSSYIISYEDADGNEGNYASIQSGGLKKTVVTNTYKAKTAVLEGSLKISKALGGESSQNGAGSATEYKAKVRIGSNFMTVTGTAPNYSYIGASKNGTEMTFSVSSPLTITGIPAGTVYEVIETSDGNFIASYEDEAGTITAAVTDEAVVTNIYSPPLVTQLTIEKALAGSPGKAGANAGTLYDVKVKAGNNYITVSGSFPNYTYTGTSKNGTTFKISASDPAVITNMPTGSTVYTVEEQIPKNSDYSATYTDNGIKFNTTGQHSTVTVTNTYVAGTGSLRIIKELGNNALSWSATNDTVFKSRVEIIDPETGENLGYLSVSGSGPYTYTGYSGTGTEIKFSVNSPAVINSIPDGLKLKVTETVNTGDHFTPSYSADSVTIAENITQPVTVTNNFKPGIGNLIITKELAGSPGDWGVNGNTVFSARIFDEAYGNYVLFDKLPDGAYWANGNAGDDLDPANSRAFVTFTKNNPAIIGNLWIYVDGSDLNPAISYRVEEVEGNYTVSYPGGDTATLEAGNKTVTVTNTYEDSGSGNLILNKTLAGSYADWNVNVNTVFQARVKDLTSGRYLLFTKEGDSYEFLDECQFAPTDNPAELVSFTAAKPVVLTGFPNDHDFVFEVREITGPRYDVSYDYSSSGDNIIVTVTNDFEHGTGYLVLSKKLAGSPGDWNVDNTTKFSARIYDKTGENFVYFYKLPDGKYYADGNSAEGAGRDYPVTPGSHSLFVEFSADSSAELTNLWANRVYEVWEDEGTNYKAVVTGDNKSFPEGGNMAVTVTNHFEHGTGTLMIEKALAGDDEECGASASSVFTARVKDVTNNNYVYFVKQEDGTYYADGNNDSPPESVNHKLEVEFSVNNPAQLWNLWASCIYTVEETNTASWPKGSYEPSYTGNSASFTHGGVKTVAVTNTFTEPESESESTPPPATPPPTPPPTPLITPEPDPNPEPAPEPDSAPDPDLDPESESDTGSELESEPELPDEPPFIDITPGDASPLEPGVPVPQVSLNIRKSLTDIFGDEAGGGKYFAVRIYDETMTLVGRVDLIAGASPSVITGLQPGRTYYLQEEALDGFTILGFSIPDVGDVAGDAVGISIPEFSSGHMEIPVIVSNRANDLFFIPDFPIPLGDYPFPDDPPILQIPDWMIPLGDMEFPDDNPFTSSNLAAAGVYALGFITLAVLVKRRKEKAGGPAHTL